MAKITAGNRLYLYKLLIHELGMGKQTPMARVAEVLEADGVWPQDLEFSDARALMEALPECVKVTVFKKGYIYATVMPCDEYDRSLALLETEPEAKAAGGKAGGKSWKRKKGPKGIKPQKPRHEEPKPARKAAVAEAAPAEEAVVEVEPQVEAAAAVEAEQQAVTAAAIDPEAEAVTEPEPNPAPVEEAEPEAVLVEATEVAEITHSELGVLAEKIEQAAAQLSAQADRAETALAPEPEPEPADAPDLVAEPVAADAPEPDPAPAISLTITYVPEPAVGAPARTTPSASGRASALPQDFYADVRCPDEPLSTLYQLLPPHADPMATLEEDFRVARSTGTLEGSRSEVTFPLRYQRTDGQGPVTATLRRTARPVAGKRWTLNRVDGGEPADLGMGSLAEETGPWTAFTTARRRADLTGAADAERALTQTVALGSWDAALAQLEAVAEPEDWGAGRQALRHYLVLAFARVQAQGLLATAADGASAAFDTGLFTPDDQRVIAHLTAGATDIPWQLADFAPATEADAAVPPLRFDAAFDPALPGLPERVARNPRLATTAYDAQADRSWLLVPAEDAGGAQALLATPDGYERGPVLAAADVYAVARVVSSEQPGWVRRLRP